MKLIYHTHFLCKARDSFLALRSTRQYFNTVVENQIKEQNHPQKAPKCEKLNLPQRGHLFAVRELTPEGRVSPRSTLTGNMYVRQPSFFAALHHL